MSQVRVEGLTIEFSSGDYLIKPLDGFGFQAKDGEMVVVLGPSGSGKTTLLSCLAGILTPTEGQISVDTKQIGRLNRRELSDYRQGTVGIVFQSFNLIPSLSAEENVAIGAHPIKGKAARERARKLLGKVDLSDRLDHRPGDLSGGQQQRVAIARALIRDPSLILADEPTAHLDYLQVEGVIRLLRGLASGDRTVIIATHDHRILPLADRVVDLSPEADHEGGRRMLEPGEVLFHQGDPGDLVYQVISGELEVLRERADGTSELLTEVPPGEWFGELAPMLGLRRAATVRAKKESELRGVSPDEFKRLVGEEKVREMVGQYN